MKRRDFIALAGAAATASMLSPMQARAQQPARPVVGFLGATGPIPDVVAAFAEGLAGAGFQDGHNVTILQRWAHNRSDRLPALVADLLHHRADVIATNGGAVVVKAVKAASMSVPIVFLVGGDPVEAGIVASLARPGGNATGVYMLTSSLNGKRLQLLHEMVPQAVTIAVLINPAMTGFKAAEAEVRAAAKAAQVQVQFLRAGNERDIDAAFASLAERRIGALMLCNDPFFNSRREQLVALATRHAVPAIFEWREFTASGGLMSYGAHRAAALREQGAYVARVLEGARPAELPVLKPTRFELVLNGRTARTLGLTIPPSLRLRADEVLQ
jgi:putative tryptophan/tyrosine transport system substrate-binding protein